MKNLKNLPFEIGDRVMVMDNPNSDETFNIEFALKSGIIVYFDYECGCGQSFPEDPMIGVKFEKNILEEFWKEELLLTP